MAYQDAIMRKAAKLTSDPRRDPPRQSQDFDTPRVDTETNRKDFNKPQQAEPIRSSEPDVILKYPQDENYLAYMLFRVKKINPWDIDVQQAKKILASTDWYVIRFLETGVPVPPEITDMRAKARELIDQ